MGSQRTSEQNMSSMLEEPPWYEIFVICLVITFCAIAFFGNFHKYLNFGWRREVGVTFRGYQIDPPEQWKCKFPWAKGRYQSPVNIRRDLSVTVPSDAYRPLVFNRQYFNLPTTLTLMNDGYGVIVGTCFDDEYPTVSGGSLRSKYRFNLAQFKWGPTDDEGSEHTIDSTRYAMELQLMHIKGDKCYENLDCAVRSKAVLFISYFFEVTPKDNPYLVPIVNGLHAVQRPNTSCSVEPFPLCWLFHPFKARFFSYQGSITCPPCTEGVEWIVQPEPLSISSNQLQSFRRLIAVDGCMRRNTRPVQKLNGRYIHFYK